MEAIKAQVHQVAFVEFNAEVEVNPIGDILIELDALKLALVGGSGGDVNY